MFALDRIDAQRIAVSAAGALFFSALCIGSAVGPAEAATPIAAWQNQSTHRLDRAIAPLPDTLRALAQRDATVSVTVAPDGKVADATMLQSSGNRNVDAALLRRIAHLRLAPIPAAGSPRKVELRIALVEDMQAPRAATNAVRYAAR
jgi:TonB family protein